MVGDNEKPLLLQSLWKPREGLARRFEIQRRSWVEERTSRDKDTVTAGTLSACSLEGMGGAGGGRVCAPHLDSVLLHVLDENCFI